MAGRLRCASTLIALLAAATIIVGCGHDDAAAPQSGGAPQVGVEVKSAQSAYPAGTPPQVSLVLRNNGSRACALPSVADGSVQVVSVMRDGAAVLGRPGREDLYNGMAAVVAVGLRSVGPGESISVPLDIEVSPSGSPAVRTSQQSAADSGRTTSWLLDQPGKYRITARLATVTGVQRTDLPEQCPAEGPAASAEFEVTP